LITNKVKIVFLLFFVLFLSLFTVLLTLKNKNHNFDKKYQLVKTVGLPDLAISTEANFIRHRSLASMFDIYKDDPDIRVYFPSSFSITKKDLYEK